MSELKENNEKIIIVEETIEEKKENIKRKKKSIDEKIEELKEKLKTAEYDKKRVIERKGRNLWSRIKSLFLIDESVVDGILSSPEKLENLKRVIEDFIIKEIKKKKEGGKSNESK